LSESELISETEVVRRLATGDEKAFEYLYRHYWDQLYSLALAFLKSPTLAEDTLQEVFTKLWLKRESIAVTKEFKPYFMAMVRHEIINTLRKKKLHLLIQGIDEIVVVSNSDLKNAFNDKEITGLVREALVRLPERQQQIFLMSREQGLTHELIARKMNISKKTIANIITLTLNHIREYLNQHGYNFNYIGMMFVINYMCCSN
jgi:RNA polymerase sigma-70 factor (ECF subfamily)